MGSLNQLAFLNSQHSSGAGRVVEVGSKDYGSTQPFRTMFEGADYIGVDLEDGDNVDLVHNLENGLGPLEPAKADLVICCSVLEHTPRPWVLAANLEALLKPGGAIYISVPWVWRYHPYPDDYFRISFSGIKSIFPNVKFTKFAYSTDKPLDFMKCDRGFDDSRAKRIDGVKFLPYLDTHAYGHKT